MRRLYVRESERLYGPSELKFTALRNDVKSEISERLANGPVTFGLYRATLSNDQEIEMASIQGNIYLALGGAILELPVIHQAMQLNSKPDAWWSAVECECCGAKNGCECQRIYPDPLEDPPVSPC